MVTYKTISMSDDYLIHGYILKRSSDSILIQAIEDFHVDGYMWLRKDQITSMRCNKTDAFQSSLLDKEWMTKQICLPFEIRWNSLLSILKILQFAEILSCTVSGSKWLDTVFGQCIAVFDTVCWMREVLADGTYKKTASRIPLDRICGLHRWGEYNSVFARYISLKSNKDIEDFFADNKWSFYDYE